MGILIFGGTGSLGHALVNRYTNVTVVSRDEYKQWEMKKKFPNVNYLIGDVRDPERVKFVMSTVNPDTVIIAAAMKHIDVCEDAIHECLGTNLMGTKNILNNLSDSVKTVCFVSTDKACSPVNSYGMCKALSENLMIEKSIIDKTRKYVTVRYGNVLNSRGSILPILHGAGGDPGVTHFVLTHENMTRFIMTLEQSVDLIDHALHYAQSGDIVIPKLVCMKIKDLLEIFSEKYNKPIKLTTLRPGEKMNESLINATQSLRLVKGENYYYIKPRTNFLENEESDYNSSTAPVSKEVLKELIESLT
jgi:FlaA1/EpsC-like NDP-sugar epimerase